MIEYKPTEKVLPKFRTRKVQLVLFGGKAGVGKTTAAYYILSELGRKYSNLNVIVRGFAAPVKEIAESCFKWNGVKDEKGRRLLQAIGTDAGREYNPNIWVEYMDEYITGNLFIPHIVLVDDWRFPNEKEYFLNNFLYDVETVKIIRDVHILDQSATKHPSENSLPENDSYYGFTINNCGTLDEFYHELDSVAGYLSTKITSY